MAYLFKLLNHFAQLLRHFIGVISSCADLSMKISSMINTWKTCKTVKFKPCTFSKFADSSALNSIDCCHSEITSVVNLVVAMKFLV